MKLKPLGDRVILKHQEAEEKTQSGIILPDSAKEKPQEAVVVAVGDGTDCEGKNVQMQVKEGDSADAGACQGGTEKYCCWGKSNHTSERNEKSKRSGCSCH